MTSAHGANIAGKPQDGIVSRFVNRPISRRITRLLLRLPITPNIWTMAIFPLLVIAFLFLLRGDYAGFVIGCAIFQIYSILDGCDGEIARAKNLGSKAGERLDTLCDTLGNLLLVIGVGLGLRAQYPFFGWIYALEGIFCAVLIAANELWLHNVQGGEEFPSNEISDALYPRHRALARSDLMILGEKNVWWLIQFTKRDVAILFFLILAIVGFPQWILHLSLLVTAITLLLSAIALLSGQPNRGSGA